MFHATYGYYAHGVGPETRKKDGTVIGWCLEVHDLVLAKLAAGRKHDYEFVDDALRERLVDVEQLRLGLDVMPDAARAYVRERLEGVSRECPSGLRCLAASAPLGR
jgi:hypothetical protein